MQDVALDSQTIEYLVIGAYLLVLVAVGFVFRSFNSDVSDYFRNGCKGTWWLVGASAFMTMFSAFTFTGAAGAAFESGFGVTIIFIGNTIGFFLVFLFLGPWYRQLRSITGPEVIRKRFGATTQQFYAWFQMLMQLLYAAIWLNGLAIFAAAVFDFTPISDAIAARAPQWLTATAMGELLVTEIGVLIVAVGVVVLLYSVFGGSWAVMATDFIQFLILIPLTILVAVLALDQVGGISGFFQTIQNQGLTEEFKLINDPAVRFASFPDQEAAANKIDAAKYGLAFAAATLLWKAMLNMSLTAAPRFFAAKTGREARLAGLLAAVMMIVGMAVWFIPPMVARMIMADEVLAQQVSKPEETAYALISVKLLPAGLTGLMVVAMFAATMSSMDSGLNRNAAIFVRDIIPSGLRLVGLPIPGDKVMFRLSQVFSMMFGLLIVLCALYFASLSGGKGIFELMLKVGALVGAPMIVPMLLALFIKRAPWWSAIVAVLAAIVPSGMSLLSGTLDTWPAWLSGLASILEPIMGEQWTYQREIFTNSIVGTVAFVSTMPFWKTASAKYRQQVDDFFTEMHTPVDFEKEVGQGNDALQLKIIGWFAVVIGLSIGLVLLVPQDKPGAWKSICFISGFVSGVGGLLIWASKREPKRPSGFDEPLPAAGSIPIGELSGEAPK